MITPHFRDFGVPRGYSLQHKSSISRKRGLERREVKVVKSNKAWQNGPSYTFQNGFQQQNSRNDFHRTVYHNPSNIQRTSSMENGRQGVKPRVPLQRTCRKYSENFPQRVILQRNHNNRAIEPERSYPDSFRLTRNGQPTKLPSGFTPLRHQQISDKESPYFPITGRIQGRKRIIGKEQDFFQPEEERVRFYDPKRVGPSKRSTKKQQTVVNTSNEASSPIIRNDISTQNEHNVVTPESTISSNTIWLQFSQFVEQTQKEFKRLHENISRLQEVNTLQTKKFNTLQEYYTKLSKASEESKRTLIQVIEEQNHCKRDKEYLDKDIYQLFNVCQNIKPQSQGNVLDIPYNQEEIKPDSLLENNLRSPSLKKMDIT
ncbi:hypothetical protein O181_089178 [Austropuccinia psidii MF-1]|uniref:Uncharacterized protein n=1 Tax=Austropuccinia psidii MF-1 TaxID=1389203 RepID=A0A9Q3IT07_9BASI|nr:hypothetical protein [Austropuccinia psidii MF-1]